MENFSLNAQNGFALDWEIVFRKNFQSENIKYKCEILRGQKTRQPKKEKNRVFGVPEIEAIIRIPERQIKMALPR